MKESIASIGGHQYRYAYDPSTKKTVYLGPVGDAPALSENELVNFLRMGASLDGEPEMIEEYKHGFWFEDNEDYQPWKHPMQTKANIWEWAHGVSKETGIQITTQMENDLAENNEDEFFMAIEKSLVEKGYFVYSSETRFLVWDREGLMKDDPELLEEVTL
jgi:hypothetical protein